MKRAFRRKYHYIYKTTCKVTGKYYIGMHSTDDLNDGYVGSGKKLGYSIRKYGVDNHVCDILEHYFTREWLREREAELVCAETLTDPKCMNLKVGGEGGFDHLNIPENVAQKVKAASSGGKKNWQKLIEDPEKVKAHKLRVSANLKSAHAAGKIRYDTFAGREHTAETKAKISKAMSAKMKGESNSQFGTCWINNGLAARKIKQIELEAFISQGWRKGRSLK